MTGLGTTMLEKGVRHGRIERPAFSKASDQFLLLGINGDDGLLVGLIINPTESHNLLDNQASAHYEVARNIQAGHTLLDQLLEAVGELQQIREMTWYNLQIAGSNSCCKVIAHFACLCLEIEYKRKPLWRLLRSEVKIVSGSQTGVLPTPGTLRLQIVPP
jgi:hypothetical protein